MSAASMNAKNAAMYRGKTISAVQAANPGMTLTQAAAKVDAAVLVSPYEKTQAVKTRNTVVVCVVVGVLGLAFFSRRQRRIRRSRKVA